MKRLVIVRHGDTFAPGETVRRIGARTDIPLSANGVAQAEGLGAYLAAASFQFRRVLTSPMLRARQTLDRIAASIVNLPAGESATWLAEIDHGPDEGMDERTVLRRVGKDALAAWEDAGTPPAGWVVDAEARIAAWRDLMRSTISGDTLIVTSNGAARFALLSLLPPRRPSVLKLRTGAFGVLRAGSTGPTPPAEWHVVGWDERPAPQAQD